MAEKLRRSGIELVGDIPWGTHFCQFYKTKRDLLDILVPYFAAGLKNNEYCMWVTCEPVKEDDALQAMKKAVPRFARHLENGQMEIIPHSKWYVRNGKFSSRRVLDGWVKKLDDALARGYEGLRLSGNTFWLEKKDWKKFTEYEETVDSVIRKYAMIALCTYSLERCDANEVADVISNHRFALIKRDRKWDLIESSERKRIEAEHREVAEELRKSNQRLELLSDTASQLLLSENPQQIVDSLCRKMLDFLGCHAFFNYFLDEKEHRLHLNAFGGIPDEVARSIEWLDLGVAVCGCAAQDGRRIVAENIAETSDPRTVLVRSFGIQAYACHPLFSQGRVIGTLSFGTRSRTSFADDELALMKTVADHVAAAMERMRHIETLRAAREALRKSGEELEIRVEERTTELARANARLRAEIERHEKAEKKIREQTALLELAHDAIIVRGLDGRIEFWNHGAEQIYGWTKEEALGRIIHDLLRTESVQPRAEIEKELMRAGRWEGELEHITRDGKHITVQSRWTLQWEADKAPNAVMEINSNITRRKAAQNALRTASLYTRSLIEASLDPLVTISADGKIMDVNTATELATGATRDQLIGSDFSEYFTEPEKARAGYKQVFEKGFVQDYALAVRHTSGRIMDVLYNATVYRNEAGDVQGVFAAARDISRRKAAEDALRAASLYTRSLIEASLDPLVTISVHGKIMDVNAATELATGATRDQLIGSDFSEYFTEPEKARAGYKQVFEKGFVRDYALAIRHASGRIIDVLYNATVYRNEAGDVQGVFAAARDISRRKAAEDALRAASLYTRSLIEASLDPLVTISTLGKIMDVNAATELATGAARNQLIGNDFSDYFTDPEKAREGYQKVFEKGFVRDYPLAIRHVSGRTTDVLYNATVYRNEAGEVQGVFAAARDVTELRQAEEKLKLYMKKLEWTNRELQDFAFVASHDLQEPLRKIQSFGERLRTKHSEQLGPDGRDYLERMHSAAGRMGALIQDLLSYSRVGTYTEPFAAVDLSAVMRDVITDLEVSIEQTGGSVQVDRLPSVEADPRQMRQLFQNLISNALKFHGDEKPVIKIYESPASPLSTEQPQADAQYQICVEDNGIGFDEKYLDRIFVPFQRLHGRGEYAGTGMGLAICRKIVERHGGSITAKSVPGKGSTFIIKLPRRQSRGGNEQ